MKIFTLFLASLLFIGLSSVHAKIQAKPLVQVEITNEVFQFSPRPYVQFQGGFPPSGIVVEIDDNTKYQKINGFGAALSESSAYVLSKLPNDLYWKTLHKLFNQTSGIGVNYLRLPISASDFSLNDYSYDDVPAGQTDDELKNFSIDRDRKYVIPVLKDILKINPKVKIMMSPWSAPAWMKTTGSMKGSTNGVESHLLPAHFQAYANFFVKAIQAYQQEGIAIDTLTIQNEPLYGPTGYPGMVMDQYDQSKFINNYLAPALINAKIDTKVFVYDHNWDRIDYPAYVFENMNAQAAQVIGGAALHCYGGGVVNQTNLHNQFPDMPIYLTECSGGDWNPGWDHNLVSDMQSQLIGGVNNWAEVALKWNLVLDQNAGPTNGGCTNCWGLLTVNTDTLEIQETVNYYTTGLFSRHVPVRASRVKVTTTDSSLLVTGFLDSASNRIVIILNQENSPRTFWLYWQGNSVQVTLAGHTVGVYKWNQ